MTKTVSKYQELWNLIKQDSQSANPQGIAIAANPNRHHTIIKAVQKRKNIDDVFKFEMAEAGKGFCKLITEKSAHKVVFKLKFSIGEGDL